VIAEGEGLDPRLTEAETEATLPLLLPPGNREFGYMDPGEWEEFIAFMADAGEISERFAPDEVLSNEYLPGEPPG
jgi:hypothetical protein